PPRVRLFGTDASACALGEGGAFGEFPGEPFFGLLTADRPARREGGGGLLVGDTEPASQFGAVRFVGLFQWDASGFDVHQFGLVLCHASDGPIPATL